MAARDILELFRESRKQPELRQELERAQTLEQLIAIARGRGYSFTQDEWYATTGFQVEELPGELSDVPGL